MTIAGFTKCGAQFDRPANVGPGRYLLTSFLFHFLLSSDALLWCSDGQLCKTMPTKTENCFSECETRKFARPFWAEQSMNTPKFSPVAIHGNFHGYVLPMGFPREWECISVSHGNRNGNDLSGVGKNGILMSLKFPV